MDEIGKKVKRKMGEQSVAKVLQFDTESSDSDTDQPIDAVADEECSPMSVDEVIFTNRLEMFKRITASIVKDRETMDVNMTTTTALLNRFTERRSHSQQQFAVQIAKLEQQLIEVKEQQNCSMVLLDRGVSLLTDGIKNNSTKIKECIEEEEARVIKEMQMHVNCE